MFSHHQNSIFLTMQCQLLTITWCIAKNYLLFPLAIVLNICHALPVDQINVQLERCCVQRTSKNRRASCQKDDEEEERKDRIHCQSRLGNYQQPFSSAPIRSIDYMLQVDKKANLSSWTFSGKSCFPAPFYSRSI